MTAGLFTLHEPPPGVIDASAEELDGSSTAVTVAGEALGPAVAAAQGAVAGALAGPMLAAPLPTVRSFDQLARAAMVGSGAVRLWGNHVREFDDAVGGLNDRWAAASRTSFGVPAPDVGAAADQDERRTLMGERADAVDLARAALRAELQRLHGLLEDDLDDDAESVAGLLDLGPTDEAVHTLLVAGALPPTALTLFPGVVLSQQDLAAMGTQLQANGLLAAWLAAPDLGEYTAQELELVLTVLRGIGVEPRDYADLLRTYWQTVSLENAGIDFDDWDISRGAGDLRPIIEAVYEYYGQLYLDNPNLQWAGLANMVGPSFAGGFLDLGMLRGFADAIDGGLDRIPGPLEFLLPPPLRDITAVSQLSEAEIRFYEETFLQMQQDIFLDMGSMHEAYNTGGMEAIDEMYEAGLFEVDDRAEASDMTYEAWQLIDEGATTGNADLLEEGTYLMAYREQYDIIQDDYDEMYERFPTGPAVTYLMTAAGEVSVPGTQTMGAYDPLTIEGEVNPPGPGKASLSAEIPLPTGNVANFDDRWDYFTNDTLPAFLELTGDDEQMEEIISGDMHDRVEEYRLLNRLDDLIADFLDNTSINVDVGW